MLIFEEMESWLLYKLVLIKPLIVVRVQHLCAVFVFQSTEQTLEHWGSYLKKNMIKILHLELFLCVCCELSKYLFGLILLLFFLLNSLKIRKSRTGHLGFCFFTVNIVSPFIQRIWVTELAQITIVFKDTF